MAPRPIPQECRHGRPAATVRKDSRPRAVLQIATASTKVESVSLLLYKGPLGGCAVAEPNPRASRGSRMSDTKPRSAQVSEHEARAVAEASRETSWTAPSFVRELFLGRLALDLIHPYPEPDPEDDRRGQEFLAKLERFLRDEVDGEQIERDSRI